MLLDLLGTVIDDLENLNPIRCPLSLGVVSTDKATLHFRKRNRPGLRFEAARFLAETINIGDGDAWLPLTDRGTARQKLQRAFAIELLAPIEEVSEFVGEEHTPERFEEAGDKYGVSALAVRSQLVNHGFVNINQ